MNPYPLRSGNPYHLACQQRMVATAHYFVCKPCGDRIILPRWTRVDRMKHRDAKDMARAQDHPWCIGCRKPMRVKGGSFYCRPCGAWTRPLKSRARTGGRGKLPPLPETAFHPWCVGCKRPMRPKGVRHGGRRFACPECGAGSRDSTVHEVERRMGFMRVFGLLKSGCSVTEARAATGRSVSFIGHVSAYLRKRHPFLNCDCGRKMGHGGTCNTRRRHWARVMAPRDATDHIMVRIERAVPHSLPAEMRDDVCQEIFMEIMSKVDQTLLDMPMFLRRYWREYQNRRNISIDQESDDRPPLRETLAG